MIAIITGSRDWVGREEIADALVEAKATFVFEGGQRGADTWGKRAAKDLCIPVQTVAADWKTYGKRAGPLRNIKMLELAMEKAKRDKDELIVLAFPLKQSIGTWHMVSIAEHEGIKVVVYES